MSRDDTDFCGCCGSELGVHQIEGRERNYCEKCDSPVYRNPRPCAGIVVVEGDSALLVQRTNPPEPGSWSVPAGFLEVDEPPLQAAERELQEETGITVTKRKPELFGTQFVQHPEGGSVLVLVYVVARRDTDGRPLAGDDAAAVRWWTVDDINADRDEIETEYAEMIRESIAAVDETAGQADSSQVRSGSTDPSSSKR